MASGFQQDLNQLQVNHYRVAVNMTGYPTTGNTGGGISPNSCDSFTTANFPTTTDKAELRARGNMRFRNIVNRLSGLTDCQIMDVTITEANADAQATALAFTVRYERDGFIPASGTMVDGSTAIASVADAIKDQVARGILDNTTGKVRVYDPSLMGEALPVVTVESPDTAANVVADVTVTINADTTLVA